MPKKVAIVMEGSRGCWAARFFPVPLSTMPSTPLNFKRVETLKVFYAEQLQYKDKMRARFLKLGDDFGIRAKKVEKKLKLQQAALTHTATNFPMVKKCKHKYQRKAWAEEEARTQRDMASYVRRLARKSDRTTLPNMTILKNMVLEHKAKRKAGQDKEEEEMNGAEASEEEDMEDDEEIEEQEEEEVVQGEEESPATSSSEEQGKKQDPREAKEEKDEQQEGSKGPEESLPVIDKSPQKEKKETRVEKDTPKKELKRGKSMQEDEDPASANSPQKKKKDEKPIEKEFVPDPAESPRKKKKKPSEKDSVSATEDRSKETKDEKTIDEEKTPKKKNRKQESRDKDSVSAKDKEDSTGFAVQREPKKQDKKDSTSVEEDGRRKKKEEAKSGDQVPGRKVEGGSRPSQERVAVAEDDKKKKKKRIVQSEDDMSAKAASSSSRKQSRRNRAEEAVSLKRGDGDHALPAGASEAEIQALSSDLKKQESLEELSKGQKDLGSFRDRKPLSDLPEPFHLEEQAQKAVRKLLRGAAKIAKSGGEDEEEGEDQEDSEDLNQARKARAKAKAKGKAKAKAKGKAKGKAKAKAKAAGPERAESPDLYEREMNNFFGDGKRAPSMDEDATTEEMGKEREDSPKPAKSRKRAAEAKEKDGSRSKQAKAKPRKVSSSTEEGNDTDEEEDDEESNGSLSSDEKKEDDDDIPILSPVSVKGRAKRDGQKPALKEVLLKGQFYIYQAVESRVKKVNEVRGGRVPWCFAQVEQQYRRYRVARMIAGWIKVEKLDGDLGPLCPEAELGNGHHVMASGTEAMGKEIVFQAHPQKTYGAEKLKVTQVYPRGYAKKILLEHKVCKVKRKYHLRAAVASALYNAEIKKDDRRWHDWSGGNLADVREFLLDPIHRDKDPEYRESSVNPGPPDNACDASVSRLSFRDTLGTAAFQEGLSNGMPVEKRTVEEAIAKAKSRQAKVRRLIHGDDDTKPPEPVPHEPQYDVVPLEIEADDLSVLLILNQTQGRNPDTQETLMEESQEEPSHDAPTDAPNKDEQGERTSGQDPNHDWRRGHSFDSSAEDPGSYRKTWSYESIGSGPGLRKASSLDSEMLAAFRRLDTVDRTADRNLQSLAVNLDKKFAEADSPDKPKIPTPSTTTPQSSPPSSQTTSPDKEPQETSNKAPGSEKPKVEAKSGPEKEQTEDSEKNSVLFEAWLNCGGNWSKSQLYINCKTKNSTKRKGVRKWMTRQDIENKFGAANAEAIILRKLGDDKIRELEVKKHPDLPDSVDMMQFLIFDSEEEIEQEEEVMEMLYKLAEGSDSSESATSNDSSSADKKKKKKKSKQPQKVIGKAGNKIREKVGLDTLGNKMQRAQPLDSNPTAGTGRSSERFWECWCQEAEQQLIHSRAELQAALDTKAGFTAAMQLLRQWPRKASFFMRFNTESDDEEGGHNATVQELLERVGDRDPVMIKLPVKLENDDPKQEEKQGYMEYTLAKAGWYGDPKEDLNFLFAKAHTDFKVMKKAGTLRIPSMSCKAFNGRVVLEYLADCSRLAARGSPATGQGRNFGGWLTREVRAGNALYSDDPKIPLQAVAMQMELTWGIKPKIHTFEHQLLETKRTRQNTRYHHCYTDEDSMRWVKGLARKANPAKLEMAVMKMNRTRFESMKARKGTDKAKKTARDRAARDNL
ncbi:unnamed protein product [Symbiodinium sp. KB8]|nr:unnamed protein product [Symbiodinium sp. KB8]